jgi:hypothetical protein
MPGMDTRTLVLVASLAPWVCLGLACLALWAVCWLAKRWIRL